MPKSIIADQIGQSFTIEGQEKSLFSSFTKTFQEGNSYALIGPSGCGKSTLLHILAGIKTPSWGSIFLEDEQIKITPAHLHWSSYFGLVFQQPLLLDELSVIENVMLKGLLKGRSFFQCYSQASEILTNVGLLPMADWHPKRLSTGQQHRIALGRALFDHPSFLLADEPTAALDENTASSIIMLMLEYVANFKIGLIVASHDRNLIQKMNEKILIHSSNFKTI